MAQIPSTSVSMDTIKSTLQGGGGSVSDDLLTFFAAGAKINPWSLHKPIHTGYVNDDFLDLNSPHFNSANFGLTPQTTNAANIVLKTAINDPSSIQWTYALPTGGSSSPYRLGDFRLYKSDATSPFRELSTNVGSAALNESITVELYCRFASYDGELGINDMSILNGKYACLIVGQSDGYPEKIYYSTDPISSHHGVVKFTGISFSNERTRYMAAAICDTKYSDNGTGYSNTYYMLPLKHITVRWESAVTSTTFIGSASINPNNGELFVSVQMTSAPNTTTAFNNVTIQVGYEGSTNIAVGTIENNGVIGSYTLSGGGKRNESKTFTTSGLATLAAEGKLYYRVIANGGSFTSGEKQLGLSI